MILDLVRHGHAVATHPDGDAARALSERGRQEVARLAADLAAHGWRPERAFTSPLLRARQTAAMLLGAVAVPPPLAVVDALAPDVDPGETLLALAAKGLGGHAVIVAHLPLLGLLAKDLTGVDPDFDPASLVRVELDGVLAPGAGRITLQIHPASRT